MGAGLEHPGGLAPADELAATGDGRLHVEAPGLPNLDLGPEDDAPVPELVPVAAGEQRPGVRVEEARRVAVAAPLDHALDQHPEGTGLTRHVVLGHLEGDGVDAVPSLRVRTSAVVQIGQVGDPVAILVQHPAGDRGGHGNRVALAHERRVQHHRLRVLEAHHLRPGGEDSAIAVLVGRGDLRGQTIAQHRVAAAIPDLPFQLLVALGQPGGAAVVLDLLAVEPLGVEGHALGDRIGAVGVALSAIFLVRSVAVALVTTRAVSASGALDLALAEADVHHLLVLAHGGLLVVEPEPEPHPEQRDEHEPGPSRPLGLRRRSALLRGQGSVGSV